MRSAPDILFLAPSGDAPSDPAPDDYLPSSIRGAANPMIVGHARFTSSSPMVAIYDKGDDIEGYAPGGGRLKMSSVPMTSAKVASLALWPGLTPVEAIADITVTATPMHRKLLDPQRARTSASQIKCHKHEGLCW
jgi:hypothetical protein